MTRLAKRLHLDDGEFTAARAAEESKPLPTPPGRKPVGWGRNIIAYLRSQDTTPDALGMRRPTAPTTPQPIVLTDWSARIADTWRHVNARHAQLAEATTRDLDRIHNGYVYGVHVASAPLLSELTELAAVTLVTWRQELRVHAEAELALIDAEMAVAL